jgi:16S rRNA C1402 N4-methylase RsmH
MSGARNENLGHPPHLSTSISTAGHASALATAHPEMHTLIGLDVDPIARATATARLAGLVEARRAGGEASSTPASASTPPPSSLTLHVRAANFRTLAAELAESGCDAADGILLDLGFSSMQV